MKVPFVDLKEQYLSIKDEMDAAIHQVLDDSIYMKGPQVEAFEAEFAQAAGAKYAVSCSSGTTALHLALLACNIGPGDEVIVPSHTFASTAEVVCHCGATPVFADINDRTYTMAHLSIGSLITERTKAIIPVHIYGQSAELDELLMVARKHNLKLIEDCAQAFGASYKGRPVGTIGDFGAFSFYPAKNLGCYGDGGAVITNDDEAAQLVRMLADHGRSSKYCHDIIGYNYRMDSLQAAILRVKLRHMPEWTKARRDLAHYYSRNLPTYIGIPEERHMHVYHLYVIKCLRRYDLMKHLSSKGILTGIHYPVPLHKQQCFEKFAKPLTITELVVDQILSLPMYPELKNEQQDAVLFAIDEFYSK